MLAKPMRKGCQLCFFMSLLSMYAGNVWSQSNAEYLKAIRGEANNLTIDTETKSTATKPVREKGGSAIRIDTEKSQAGAIEELVPGLSVSEFEVILKNNYMGSYLFYKNLNDSDKDEVYSFYLQNPDPRKLREKILQLNKR